MPITPVYLHSLATPLGTCVRAKCRIGDLQHPANKNRIREERSRRRGGYDRCKKHSPSLDLLLSCDRSLSSSPCHHERVYPTLSLVVMPHLACSPTLLLYFVAANDSFIPYGSGDGFEFSSTSLNLR